MPRPVLESLDMAVHDRRRGAQADTVSGFDHFEPFVGANLVGTQHRTYFVVENFSRGARQSAESGLLQSLQKLFKTDAQRLCALPYLQRRKRMHMHVWLDGF